MKRHPLLSITALRLAGRGIFLSVTVAVMILGMVVPLHAEEQLPDTFSLKVGGYFIRNADTIMRLDSNNLPIGSFIDFSDTLGGDTSTSVAQPTRARASSTGPCRTTIRRSDSIRASGSPT